eukprot:2548842-Pyramimonas_sp.AAC.1
MAQDSGWPSTGALAQMTIGKVVDVLRSDSASVVGCMIEALDEHLVQLRQRDAQANQSEWKEWACTAAQEKGGRAA